MTAFHLFVRLVALPGRARELEGELLTLAKNSLNTDICTAFHVGRSSSDPEEFLLFESFTSEDVYDTHVGTDHAQHFLHHTLTTMVGQREVTRLTPHSED